MKYCGQLLGSYAVSGGLQEEIIPASQMYPNGAPVIISAPQAQSVERGTTAIFSVLSTGQNLTYQWFKNGFAIPSASGASLLLANVQAADAASYTAMVSNAQGADMTYALDACFYQFSRDDEARVAVLRGAGPQSGLWPLAWSGAGQWGLTP